MLQLRVAAAVRMCSLFISLSIMVVSRHIRRLTLSRERWLHECRATRYGVGRICALVGATATHRLSRLGFHAVKYWQRKWNNPNLHTGAMHHSVTLDAGAVCVSAVCLSVTPRRHFIRSLTCQVNTVVIDKAVIHLHLRHKRWSSFMHGR